MRTIPTGFFLTQKNQSFRIDPEHPRGKLFLVIGLCVLNFVLGTTSIGECLPNEEFDNNSSLGPIELLDEGATAILMGASGSLSVNSKTDFPSTGGEKETENVMSLSPDLTGTNPGEFDERIEWVDFEDANLVQQQSEETSDSFLDEIGESEIKTRTKIEGLIEKNETGNAP